MKWRPHTEVPVTSEPMSALIALRSEVDVEFFLLYGLFTWWKGKWTDENTNKPLEGLPFWWLPEDELMAVIEK